MADPVQIKWRDASKRVFGTGRGRMVYLIVASLVALIIGYLMFTVYVRPNQFGILQVTVGVSKGIKPGVLTSGLHWVTPGTERIHLFPTDVQVLNFTNDPNERSREDELKLSALNIQTSEGYNVTSDTSVLYRIEDPYKVITTLGPGRLYEQSLVVPRAEQTLRKRLGELDAEQFYDVEKRSKRVALALEDLNADLIPAGVRALAIFVRNYAYDDRYQQAIEQRKIQDQNVFKNKAEAEMAQANAEKDRIVAEGEAAVKVELARG